eukprot:3521686-Amphidinium_carterae.1
MAAAESLPIFPSPKLHNLLSLSLLLDVLLDVLGTVTGLKQPKQQQIINTRDKGARWGSTLVAATPSGRKRLHN